MATLDDIIEAKNRHCLRRARALCKIYAGEMYGETAKHGRLTNGSRQSLDLKDWLKRNGRCEKLRETKKSTSLKKN